MAVSERYKRKDAVSHLMESISSDRTDCRKKSDTTENNLPAGRSSQIVPFELLYPLLNAITDRPNGLELHYANAACNIFRLLGIAVRGSSFPSNSRET